MDDTIPTDRIYTDGVTVRDALPETFARSQTTWDDLDWNTSVDLSPETAQFTASVAAHCHYAKISHILLYQRLMNEHTWSSMQDQRLFITLSAFNVERLDVWEQYMTQIDATATVLPELKTYYRTLFHEDDPTATLLGMEALGITATALYKAGQIVDAPLFNHITEKMIAQKEGELDEIVDHLQTRITDHTTGEQTTLIARTADHVDQLEVFLEGYRPILRDAGIDHTALIDTVNDDLRTFYSRIGLIQPIQPAE